MKGSGEEKRLLPAVTHTSGRRRWNLATSALLLLFVFGVAVYHTGRRIASTDSVDKISRCAIRTLRRDTNDHAFLRGAKPIENAEYFSRRDRLAQVLVESTVDAFVFEPGHSASLYYANFSQHEWEPWEPEERPLLGLILPTQEEDSAARLVFLAPKFEEDRLRRLDIPNGRVGGLEIVTYEEHENPYAILREGLFSRRKEVGLMIDEEMRDFIVRGLGKQGLETLEMSVEAQQIQQIKSPAEIEILRAVNTGTVEAVRAASQCLVLGLREKDVIEIIDNTLLDIGFSLFFNLVLFDENAALPHGGTPQDKTLDEETLILVDVGAQYLRYSSDISRSFMLSNRMHTLKASVTSLFRREGISPILLEKYKAWTTVMVAQSISSAQMQKGRSAAGVDLAARRFLEQHGYGPYFTHRVGHSIGIKAHEPPYLHKGNTMTKLLPGMVFTSEPGVYLPGKFGVRIEDVWLVTDATPELLTGKLATDIQHP